MMGYNIPVDMLTTLHAQMVGDPELPRAEPTTSFWQIPPHPEVSDTQSADLPLKVDFAIIGSGVTGCSIAKHLLELAPSTSVTVLEARTLCSGATGRNGGLLTPFVPREFATLAEDLGIEQAVKVARFANRTLEKMHALANSSPELKEASEVRRLRGIICYKDKDSFDAAKVSTILYQEHVPEDRGTFQVLSPEDVCAKYKIRESTGGIEFDCGAFWPYRLITAVWAQLKSQFPSRLSIETQTPVTAINKDTALSSEYPYKLATPRGTICAAHVIHATNGFTGHLLPRLRGSIFPLRGTMSSQKPPGAFGNYGTERAWSFGHKARIDAETGVLELGLYYSNQNPRTGDLFIGGEKVRLDELIVSDDTAVSETSKDNISSIIPKLFDQSENGIVHKVWSGIMAFTADHSPIVGRLPSSMTGRGDGEWAAAGFNGYGMPLCWSSGEAVAKMLMGIDVRDFLPESFLSSEERLGDAGKMDPKAALSRILQL